MSDAKSYHPEIASDDADAKSGDEKRHFDLLSKSLDYYSCRGNQLLEVSDAIPPAIAGLDYSDFESNRCNILMRLLSRGGYGTPPICIAIYKVSQYKQKLERYFVREAVWQLDGFWGEIDEAVRVRAAFVACEPKFAVRDAEIAYADLMAWIEQGSGFHTQILILNPKRYAGDDFAYFEFGFFNGPSEIRLKWQLLQDDDPWLPFEKWYHKFWDHLESLLPGKRWERQS